MQLNNNFIRTSEPSRALPVPHGEVSGHLPTPKCASPPSAWAALQNEFANNSLGNSPLLPALEVAFCLPWDYFANKSHFSMTDLLISVILVLTIFLCERITVFSISQCVS